MINKINFKHDVISEGDKLKRNKKKYEKKTPTYFTSSSIIQMKMRVRNLSYDFVFSNNSFPKKSTSLYVCLMNENECFQATNL